MTVFIPITHSQFIFSFGQGTFLGAPTVLKLGSIWVFGGEGL